MKVATLYKKNIAEPHESRKFKANGHVDVVTLGTFTLGRGTFDPGWHERNYWTGRGIGVGAGP